MRQIIAIFIMVHEYPFNIIEDEFFDTVFIGNDCLAIYDAEKKTLKVK